MRRLVAIVGPTGIGKTRLALHLARHFPCEVVSADSRQVRRHMEIGTAKPTPEEQALVPHHLINIVDPDDDFSLAQYQALAYRAITDIQHRGKLPLLVGGSGQYVWAVIEGWRIPAVPPDPAFRRNLEARAAAGEAAELFRELARIDPAAAQKIDPHNVRRVIRALEVYGKTRTPFSRLRLKDAPGFASLVIGLTCARGELYRRIEARVDEMVARGLAAEVENLVKMGYDFNLSAMSGIGYRQMANYLRGECELAVAVQEIKTATHRFARHQYAWFRLTDDRIHWFDVQDGPEEQIAGLVAEFVKGLA